MANLLAKRFARKPYSGAEGDLSCFTSAIVLVAGQIGDVINFAEMPAGCEIVNIELVNDALGASSTLNIGFKYTDGTVGAAEPTAFKAAASTASAGKLTTAFHPRMFNDAITITSTIAGAAVTGTVTAIITYRYVGTM